MARRRKRPTDDHGGGGGGGHGGASGRWLVSYADFITLMFVVFVVLFSFANIDLAKYRTLGNSLRSAMGPPGPTVTGISTRGLPGQAMPLVPDETAGSTPDVPDWPTALITQTPEGERAAIPPAGPPPADARPSEKATDPVSASGKQASAPKPVDEMDDLATAFQALPGARSGLLQVSLEERGIVMSIAGSLLFDAGQTTLKAGAKTYLDQVAGKLSGVELPIMVEGTADQTASGSLSPWDLAALRAGAVVHYFVQEKGLPGSRFVTIGYGAQANAADGTERQVTIVVMRKKS